MNKPHIIHQTVQDILVLLGGKKRTLQELEMFLKLQRHSILNHLSRLMQNDYVEYTQRTHRIYSLTENGQLLLRSLDR